MLNFFPYIKSTLHIFLPSMLELNWRHYPIMVVEINTKSFVVSVICPKPKPYPSFVTIYYEE